MEMYWKLLALVLAGTMAGLLLRGSPFRTVAALAAAVLGGMLLLRLLEPVSALLRELTGTAQLSPALFAPVWKAAAIGLLTEAVGSFCADAGEQALGKLLELGGMLAMLHVSLPLFEAVLGLLRTMMEG